MGSVFFQWIDSSNKFDPWYLFFDQWWKGRNTREHFKRWVPPPLNLPPMTDEEKNLTTNRQLDSPPWCDCGYHVVICPETQEHFMCPNSDYVSA
jgi:hypothetical protein